MWLHLSNAKKRLSSPWWAIGHQSLEKKKTGSCPKEILLPIEGHPTLCTLARELRLSLRLALAIRASVNRASRSRSGHGLLGSGSSPHWQ